MCADTWPSLVGIARGVVMKQWLCNKRLCNIHFCRSQVRVESAMEPSHARKVIVNCNGSLTILTCNCQMTWASICSHQTMLQGMSPPNTTSTTLKGHCLSLTLLPPCLCRLHMLQANASALDQQLSEMSPVITGPLCFTGKISCISDGCTTQPVAS